jgi:hypothetical protein
VFTDQANLSGGYLFFFEKMCKPANGARAERSNRDEEYGVDPILLEETSQVTGRWLHLFGVGRTHIGVVEIGDTANNALSGQLAKSVQREDDVPVLLETGAVEVR